MTSSDQPRHVSLDRRTAMGSMLAAGSMLSIAGWWAPSVRADVAAADPRASQQWWTWRGPSGNNHAAQGTKVPDSISEKNIVWSVDIPGRGHSTPILVDDALYMATADKASGTQAVLKITTGGKPVWMQPIHKGGLPAENHSKNTEASSTLTYDGESLFAVFYNNDAIRLTRLSTNRKIIWQKNIGYYRPNQYKYGYAASPLIHGSNVIVIGDFDGESFLAAVDRETGTTTWKVRRPKATSFSSPIVASIGGRDQLLISGTNMVASYDPASGDLNWKSEGATTMATCGTMLWDDQRVYASGGYPEAETVCVAADGSGRVLWSNHTKCYEQSMLLHEGFLYAIADSGVAHCWRASDGETMWRQRLGGNYSSSPILVGNTIHVFNEDATGFAFAATPDGYRAKGQCRVGSEAFASPIVVGDTMYLRVATSKADRRQENVLAVR